MSMIFQHIFPFDECLLDWVSNETMVASPSRGAGGRNAMGDAAATEVQTDVKFEIVM